MNDSPLQLAKREWHGFWASQTAWIVTLAAGVLLGLAGPFGTDAVLGLIPRLMYWVTVAFMSYLTGLTLNAVLNAVLPPQTPRWLMVAVIALAIAVTITMEIAALNAAVFGFVPGIEDALILFGNTYAAALVITACASWITAQEPTSADTTTPPKLLDRLPHAKRGALISLSAVDHYVDVATAKGSELVLMRLSDAIAETKPTEGLQVHRSHWVARDHVRDSAREAGKVFLILSDDRRVPVSRTYLPAVRDAGWMKGNNG